ncbi:hypothetical protein KOY49_02435 [Candidatus Minimicrobia vallesae]|uniref:Uncharacterized protein n=1 Tax=Candidatus Minimicrobia vallesae TaxID=2841264 RepID=A0A8F1MAG2_9BACT|nr:hypothetical protein [Candidatus Minimicrobia vallesae]QWQ31821.1 hypothetical protein KOY49_02435 [Candidatus Minimicrobia vallesae]
MKREFLDDLEAYVKVSAENPLIIPTLHNKFDDPMLIIAFELTLLGNRRVSEEVEELAYLHPQDIVPKQLDSTLINKLAVLICDINQ